MDNTKKGMGEDMENFATYILNEKNEVQKMIIAYYLSRKEGIFFDKSSILKMQIASIFVKYMKIKVDFNQVVTAMLLCNCKKIDNMQQMGRLETYAKEGADYLRTLGFSKKFCKICEEVNRYSESEPREKESDILELVDQYTGLILNRVERGAFSSKEALMILRERNLKGLNNRYLEQFCEFIGKMEEVYIKEVIDVPIIKKLVSIHNREANVKTLIAVLGNKYIPMFNKVLKASLEEQSKPKVEHLSVAEQELKTSIQVKNKALFSKEVAERIMKHKTNFRVEE